MARHILPRGLLLLAALFIAVAMVRAEDRLAERFKQLDRDADGKVTRQEFPQPQFFDPLDLNGDDTLTLDEARRAFLDPAVRAKFGQPKPNDKPEKSDKPQPQPTAPKPTDAATKLAPVRQGPQLLKPSEHGVGRLIGDVEFRDLSDKSHQLSQWRERRAIAVCMTSTTCPLSKKYLPTLIDLAKSFGPRGVQFVLVNTVATDDRTAMREAAAQLPPGAVYVADQDEKLAQAVGAKSTTDVIVLDATRTVVYHGAVDDQYGFGYAIDVPRRRYLADALEAVLAGRPPLVAATAAPGCVLDVSTKPAMASTVTYHNRISRILARNCVECHRTGGVGPFALTTPEEVAAHAPMIQQVVERGIMPPWFAATSANDATAHWANDRSLSSTEKQELFTWLAGGRPLGDPRDGIVMPDYKEGWLIGKPDAVFEFAAPVAIKATGTMPYQNIRVQTNLPEDKWVRAIEVQPGDRGVVHHVLVFVEHSGEADDGPRDDAADERSGFWAIYVPGNSTLVYPPGFAKRLPKGAQLRFQMHDTPNGTATEDRTRIGLVFADQPPEHEVRVAGVVNARISIPPGTDNHREEATLRLPFDIEVLGFLPHMHLRGKACRYEALGADNESQMLLDIPRYDFNWQLLYRYYDPLPLARGTSIRFTAWYDNSDQNPANPDPTKTVRWGSQTFDEMHLGYVEYYVPGVKPGEGASMFPRRAAGSGGFGAGMLFGQLDANHDGRVTKDELKPLSERAPRFKDNPAAVDNLFRRLDRNADGALDRDELGTLVQLMQLGRTTDN